MERTAEFLSPVEVIGGVNLNPAVDRGLDSPWPL